MTVMRKWRLHRAGLFNFWYYDEEEFHFADGKLLLRGANSSGKSVTMQSLIPLLLDGRKSPDRLDPFGSRSRRIEDYLLGEKDVVERDERTGYLYLEYKREGVEQYLTTGIGLRARRQGPLDFWGFVVKDNRRVGRDLFFYKTERGAGGEEEKIPLTRTELEPRLGSGGRVVRSQHEYMQLVNKSVFGFRDTEAFEDLIKLLLQLRSPKLSKDFRPTVIYEILNESLPPLSDAELRPLSDTIENMDQIRLQLAQLERDQAAVRRLCRQYDQYNHFVLAEKAQGFLRSDDRLQKKRQKLVLLAGEKDSLERQLEDMEREKRVLAGDLEALGQEKDTLSRHEVFDREKEKHDTEVEKSRLLKEQERKEEDLRRKKEKERELRRRLDTEEEKRDAQADLIEKQLGALDREGREAIFTGHRPNAEKFLSSYRGEEFLFEPWLTETESYRRLLEQLQAVLREEKNTRYRHGEADRELGEARRALDEADIRQRDLLRDFEEERNSLLKELHLWREGCRELVLEPADVRQMAARCATLFEGAAPEDLRQVPLQARQRAYNELERGRLGLEQQKREQKKEEARLEAELISWRQKKDPEPQRHSDTQQARADLAREGIPHLPFYAAVEFRDHVPEETRERLEGALAQMGLLDALIVPERAARKPLHDRVIRPAPHVLRHTLQEYLVPTPVEGVAVSAADIDAVLRSVLLGDEAEAESPAVSEDGSYRISLLAGHAPRTPQAQYIGREARRRYREREMARLGEELAAVREEIIALDLALVKTAERQARLEEELQAFPRTEAVAAAHRDYTMARQSVDLHRQDVERKDGHVKRLHEELRRAEAQVRVVAAEVPVKPEEEECRRALSALHNYARGLQQLQLGYKDYRGAVAMLGQLEGERQAIGEDAGRLKEELEQLGGRLNVQNKKLATLEELLSEMGAEAIRERIGKVSLRLQELPGLIGDLKEKSGAAGEHLRQLTENIGVETQALARHESLLELWRKVFDDELKLGLAALEDDMAERGTAGDLQARARVVARRYGRLLQDSDREKMNNGLNRVFFAEQGILVEYRPNQNDILAIDTGGLDLEAADDEVMAPLLLELKRTAGRTELLLEYDGKRVSPYVVREGMQRDVDVQKQVLSEKDRKLYEEIVLHSVGRIIRERIGRAERWVTEIDRLMAERNTSSGLTFSLNWRPCTAEREEELDTRELVELLRRDPRLLREDDIDRVIRHFRSKVERAREALEEKGHGETFHQLIREMLDYRRWFSFTLYYRREGRQKKELTNHVFNTFSGGEKAMAMYIPLFSAAYSRYREAAPDAPYIISLDEAFAGVDEQNIRDMFDLMEQLGFNYLINSQALWGDYDTVRALSICELIRPQDAAFVSVARYLWNGRTREFVQPGVELQEIMAQG